MSRGIRFALWVPLSVLALGMSACTHHDEADNKTEPKVAVTSQALTANGGPCSIAGDCTSGTCAIPGAGLCGNSTGTKTCGGTGLNRDDDSSVLTDCIEDGDSIVSTSKYVFNGVTGKLRTAGGGNCNEVDTAAEVATYWTTPQATQSIYAGWEFITDTSCPAASSIVSNVVGYSTTTMASVYPGSAACVTNTNQAANNAGFNFGPAFTNTTVGWSMLYDAEFWVPPGQTGKYCFRVDTGSKGNDNVADDTNPDGCGALYLPGVQTDAWVMNGRQMENVSAAQHVTTKCTDFATAGPKPMQFIFRYPSGSSGNLHQTHVAYCRAAAVTTTLNTTALTSGATTFTVVSGGGASFPTSNFNVLIGTELIRVGSRSGDVFSSLTRGAQQVIPTSSTGSNLNVGRAQAWAASSAVALACDANTLIPDTMLTPRGSNVLPTCSDVVKNGSETAIDCGGLDCTGCGTGSACSVGTDCTSGVCTGSICTAPDGSSCTGNAQCISNSCLGGFCCGTSGCADDGNVCTTEVCQTGTGTCLHDPGNAGAVCRAAPGVCDVAETCTGASATCPVDAFAPSTTACGQYACSGTATTCPTSCATDANCAPTAYCNGSNVCVADQGNGGACTTAGQCSSGNCIDGVCCNSTCGGGLSTDCQACGATSSSGAGTCGTVTSAAAQVCRVAVSGCDAAEVCPGPQSLSSNVDSRTWTDYGSAPNWNCTASGTTTINSTTGKVISTSCTLTSGYTLNSSITLATSSNGTSNVGVPQLDTTGPNVMVVRLSGLTLSGNHVLSLIGNKPIVLLVAGNVSVASGGKVTASATGTTPGAGGDVSCGTTGKGAAGGDASGGDDGAGGGGGGGMRTAGGLGGSGGKNGNAYVGAGGTAGVVQVPDADPDPNKPLRGGCGGGIGGNGRDSGNADGGAGGGAVEIGASGTITVGATGVIAAAGAAGGATDGGDEDGGGGGGSGGMVLLEAPTFDLQSGSWVTANGGGGGGGADSSSGASGSGGGQPSTNIDATATPAAAGTPASGAVTYGGVGGVHAKTGSSAITALDPDSGVSTMADGDGGGGGGGGAGWVVINGVAQVTCPTNIVAVNGTVCRAAADECDLTETCDGVSGSCPAFDSKQPDNTACTADANPCSLDKCDGTLNACQHPVGNAGAVCRTAVGGGCDAQETCTGASLSCPADVLASNGTVCRASAGACDPGAEVCDGVSNTCPADIIAGGSTVCRAIVAGGCDPVAETCGGSNSCPADTYTPGTTCRAAVAGGCDVADVCIGGSTSCPADAVVAASTVCRAIVAGGCDPVAETCNGSANTCPVDTFALSTTVCRGQTNICDAPDFCTGTSSSCPTDAFADSGTDCAYTPGTTVYASGAPGANAQDFNSAAGDFGTQTLSNVTGPDGWTNALSFAVTTTATAPADRRSYWQFANTARNFSAADAYIEYDVRLGSSASLIGGLDIKNTDLTYFRSDAEWVDQDGAGGVGPNLSIAPASATTQWYHRRLKVPTAMKGKTASKWDVVDESEAASRTYTAYYDNVVLTTVAGACDGLNACKIKSGETCATGADSSCAFGLCLATAVNSGLKFGSIATNNDTTTANPGNLGIDHFGPTMSEAAFSNTSPYHPWPLATTFVWTGEVFVPVGGLSFYALFDDNAWLKINGTQIFASTTFNVAVAGTTATAVSTATSGWYSFELRMGNNTGGGGKGGTPGFGYKTGTAGGTVNTTYTAPRNTTSTSANLFRYVGSACATQLVIGAACSNDPQCVSGFCVDSLCCNTACGGDVTTDCLACSIAAGASSNGTCATAAVNTVCRPADILPGANGTTAPACDLAEVCDGVATTCPADTQ